MTPRVRLVDLPAQHQPIASELGEALSTVVAKSDFILGENVAAFERAAAGYLGAASAVGVSSGTDALVVALSALGVGPGDAVILAPFGFFATVEAVLRVGAKPLFVDLDPRTLELEAEPLRDAIRRGARALVVVHLYGRCVGSEAMALARAQGVSVVEDAAQAFGSRVGGRAAGTLGTLGCFSFFPTKVLGALGDAGLVVSNDEHLVARCRRLRQHGTERRDEYLEVGGNFRMDALQAAALQVKLRRLGGWLAVRRRCAAAYDDAFGGMPGLYVFPLIAGHEWNAAVYTVRVLHGRRDELRRFVGERGVETAVYYPRPMYTQPALRALGGAYGAHPESDRLCEEVLSLPVHESITESQCEHVIASVAAFFR